MAQDGSRGPRNLLDVLRGEDLPEGRELTLGGRTYRVRGGILRQDGTASAAQSQTERSFGFKWERRDTYESEQFQRFAHDWLVERYLGGDAANLDLYVPDDTVVLDAGCGAGHSAALLLGERIRRLDYIGVDISTAVDVARQRFAERGWPGRFLQANFTQLPLPDGSLDAILAEGTLHHTDSTREAVGSLARLLRPGGHFLFYVYRRKGPIREFTDDLVRERLADMTDEEAWNALLPLSRLGQALGKLQVELELTEPINLLGIPPGKIDLQRFFYWHVLKAFYRADLGVEEMNHINFDWFRPTNAHRQSPEEVAAWCEEFGLDVVHRNIQEAGITVVAKKRARRLDGDS